MENTKLASIDIKRIETKPLQGKVSKFVKLETEDGETAVFSIGTIGKTIEAWKYNEKLFLEEDRKYSDFKIQYERWTKVRYDILEGTAQIESLPKIDPEIINDYQAFLARKQMSFLKAVEASMIEKFGKKTCTSMQDKMEANKKLGIHLWKKFQAVMSESFNYGVDPNVKFFSEELGIEISRRFHFRLLDILQGLDDQDHSGIKVSFSS
jgi:hypothetical protein